MQHHAPQRPPLALAPVSPLARRLRNNARPLKMQLEPGVAPTKAVILDEMLVEMLDREALIALAVEPLHFFRPVGRDPLAPRLAEPAVDEAGLALILVSSASSGGTSALSPRATRPPPPGSAPPLPIG